MGREGGSTSLGVEEKQGTQRENVMWPAVRPDILLLSFFLGLSMWAGRNGDRKQPPPPPSLPPFVLSYPPSALHSLSHSLLMPPPLHHHPFSFSSSPSHLPPLHSRCFFSLLRAWFLLHEFPELYPPPPHLPVCLSSLTHRRARAS